MYPARPCKYTDEELSVYTHQGPALVVTWGNSTPVLITMASAKWKEHTAAAAGSDSS